ncbi:hypothetical protein SAMN05518672_10568 [Chitinophaga sp. CF118]|nr:hypothetical protein SAMN05518672_10568 [Chitinophaga sp. CF118]
MHDNKAVVHYELQLYFFESMLQIVVNQFIYEMVCMMFLPECNGLSFYVTKSIVIPDLYKLPVFSESVRGEFIIASYPGHIDSLLFKL